MSDAGEMKLLISGIVDKEGNKKACVYFEDENIPGRYAEGYVPDCKIVRQQGFSEEEITKLEEYLLENIAAIKREAQDINPIKAMMKE